MYENIVSMLNNMDWTYQMSDDYRAQNAGSAALDNILSELVKIPREDAKALWDQYVPKGIPGIRFQLFINYAERHEGV